MKSVVLPRIFHFEMTVPRCLFSLQRMNIPTKVIGLGRLFLALDRVPKFFIPWFSVARTLASNPPIQPYQTLPCPPRGDPLLQTPYV